jgi:hypothetical protein
METSRTFLVILQDFRKKRQNFVDNPIEDQDDVSEQILSISDQLFPEDVVWMDMCLIVPLIQL